MNMSDTFKGQDTFDEIFGSYASLEKNVNKSPNPSSSLDFLSGVLEKAPGVIQGASQVVNAINGTQQPMYGPQYQNYLPQHPYYNQPRMAQPSDYRNVSYDTMRTNPAYFPGQVRPIGQMAPIPTMYQPVYQQQYYRQPQYYQQPQQYIQPQYQQFNQQYQPYL
jgi:hypothetical protein